MQNEAAWQPSKFIMQRGRLRASRDLDQVSRGSRFINDLVAGRYQEMVESHARGRLLDLGCGRVPLYEAYRGQVEHVTCVDWLSDPNFPSHLDHELDLNEPLALETAAFDTILLTDVLEHVSQPERLWSEMSRVLAPGGKLLLGVPFLYWIHAAPHDHHRYTQYRLAQLCADSGLELDELEPYGGAGEVIIDISAKLIGRFRMLSFLHLRTAQLFSRSWLGRQVRARTQRTFPLGYRLVATKPLS